MRREGEDGKREEKKNRRRRIDGKEGLGRKGRKKIDWEEENRRREYSTRYKSIV